MEHPLYLLKGSCTYWVICGKTFALEGLLRNGFYLVKFVECHGSRLGVLAIVFGGSFDGKVTKYTRKTKGNIS